jgi:cytochrome b subunit of formate dehydrogenase/mono/diheme cytochrome c family protein
MARKPRISAQPRAVTRFTPAQRIAHLFMLLSFTTLGVTGLAQKYPLNGLSVFLVRLAGGIENARGVHHLAATVLMLLAIYHILDVGYKVFVLHARMTMLPSLQDVRDAWTAFRYNIGLGRNRPQMGRYTFEEKAEYWALVWGTVVMGITGFMMWNPLATTRVLPGEFIPAAKAAHGGEAVLAVLAIIIWHMYGVHLKRFNRSMWTGSLTEEEMLHEHPLELADLKAGAGDPHVPEQLLRRRQTIYYPAAGVLAAAMLFAVYGFVSGEQTAITTVPPRAATIPVYVPQTPTPLPPTPTPSPIPTTAAGTSAGTSVSTAWADVAPIFAARCGQCHGAAASGGLNLSTYADVMKGALGVPVIVAGDPDNSLLFELQSSGGHYGQLTADELAIIKAWIDAGAVER